MVQNTSFYGSFSPFFLKKVKLGHCMTVIF